MVDSGSMNMMGRCISSDNIVENFKFLDFPMENVEGGAYEEEEEVEECDDWNAKLQSALGPIPVEFLSRCLNGNITNGGSELKINDSEPVTDDGESELTKPLHLIEDISTTNKSEAVQPLSPISVLDDNNSRMFATHIPRRARTKRSRPSNNKKWTYNMLEKDVTKKKRKIAEKKTSTNISCASKRCSHCQVTQTPQWREGPMGPKTLCNACGVRYRSGRLFPEYRPMASPGFVPSLHSNSHKKVLEMRNKGSNNMNIHNFGTNVAPVPPRRRVKKAAPVYERENSPPPEFIPMSDYLLDCVLGSEVFNY